MTVTAYYTAAPEKADYLFVVGNAGEHIVLALAEQGDLATARLDGMDDDVKAAAQAPSPVEDLEVYLAGFQARATTAPAPMTTAEKLAAIGLSKEELLAHLSE